ncbi:hypothetical protein Brsp06_02443 [Brucella sp. NBRC 13694]|jgi:hypothetical protein
MTYDFRPRAITLRGSFFNNSPRNTVEISNMQS